MNASRNSPARALLAVALLGAFLPLRAEAHLVTTGLGPVYDGIAHFARSPADSVPALALALLAGLCGTTAGRFAMFALPLAWLAGGLAALAVAPLPEFSRPVVSAIIAGTFIALGIMVAADFRLPPEWVAGLAVALGGIHGFLNAAAMTEDNATPGAVLLQLTGIALTLFVLVALAAAVVVSLRQPWTRVTVRVAGSWTAAIGVLLLGWALSGRG